MKHIVIDARLMSSSTGRYVDRLVRYLQQIDTAHRYSILLEPKDYERWEPTNPNFTKVLCPFKPFSLGEQTGLKRQLEALKPDLVHFSMVQQPAFYKGRVVTTMQDLTTIRFRNPAKNPIVFTVKQFVYKWLNKRVAHKSLAIITPSDFVRHDVAHYAHISLDKITYTHESVDAFDESATVMSFFKDKEFIMGDGRARPHKNLDRQLKAFAKIHQTHPDLYFMLTGKKDATAAKFEQRLHDSGLADRVILTDFIPDGQLKWAMAHCRAYIWASLSEGFGLPPLEAMLNGAPVAASSASCIPEVLGLAAAYFNPYDVDDMARVITDVIDNDKLRNDLIKKGQQHVKKFSWKRMAEQTLAVYNRVLE